MIGQLLVITADNGDRFVEAASFVQWLRDNARVVGQDRMFTSRQCLETCAFMIEQAVGSMEPVDPTLFFEK